MTAPTELDETPAEEFSRLIIEFNEGERQNRSEAWNLIADFAMEHSDTILRALRSLPASEAGWREMPAPSLERVVVAGWHPARQMTRGYWWYHEDCTDDAGKPMDHPEATLWLPLSDLLPAFPSAPDRRPA